MASTGRAELFLLCSFYERTIAWPTRRNGRVGARVDLEVREDLSTGLLLSSAAFDFASPDRGKIRGPVQNRWCYATKRMQKTLRAKCKNKRRIEASMAEAFITEEATNFVTHTTKPKIVICII